MFYFLSRGLFIIDDRGILRQITMNDLPVGRSVDETLRLVQAFQYTDSHGEVCPAGWKPGSATVNTNLLFYTHSMILKLLLFIFLVDCTKSRRQNEIFLQIGSLKTKYRFIWRIGEEKLSSHITIHLQITNCWK